MGVRTDDELVSWVLTQNDGAIGVLYTAEAHRGKGLARSMIARLVRRYCEDGAECPPFAFILDDNTKSQRVFFTLGFEKVASVVWTGIDLKLGKDSKATMD